MCQSVARPCSAVYWHMGETKMRLGRTRLRTVSCENRALITFPLHKEAGVTEGPCGLRSSCRPVPPIRALCAIAAALESLVRRSWILSDGQPGAPADARERPERVAAG